jgi:hypothetical protein
VDPRDATRPDPVQVGERHGAREPVLKRHNLRGNFAALPSHQMDPGSKADMPRDPSDLDRQSRRTDYPSVDPYGRALEKSLL